MSYDIYDLKSELADKDALEFERKAISYQPMDINRLVKHPREKLDHYIAKSVLFYILRKCGHDVLSELGIVGVGKGYTNYMS